ncbi:MAG TPA: hypothetical protein DHV48_07065 [Prolixibacteraceae bacterium]|nr:MAG: hypothetical protein A2066_15745 [Bacteroidetes bacterium GWB2_41_8]HCY41102.1 hypothetical protein [Prolixibacteraceae bacterium]
MLYATQIRGAEYRNIDTYLFVVLRCAAPYQLFLLFYYKYFAALLPLIADDPTANGFLMTINDHN